MHFSSNGKKKYKLIILCMAFGCVFTGCNSKKEVSFDDIDGSNSGNIACSNGGDAIQSLSEYFNVANNSCWKDSFNVEQDNNNFLVDINARVTIPECDRMNVVSMKEAVFKISDESDLVDCLFNTGTAEEFHGFLQNVEMLVGTWGYDALGVSYTYDEESGFSYVDGDLEIVGWQETEQVIIHSYHGMIDEKEYELVMCYGTDNLNSQLCLSIIDTRELYPEYDESPSYLDENNILINTDEAGRDILLEEANIQAEEAAINCMDELLGKLGMDNQEYRIADSLYFYDGSLGNMTNNELIKDGYRLSLGNNIWYDEFIGLIPNSRQKYCPKENSGYVDMCSQGLICININKCADRLDSLSDNTGMVGFDSIKEKFICVLQEELDAERLPAGNILFDELRLAYYIIKDDNQDSIYCYIPSWFLVAGDNETVSKCTVIVNAVDGELLDILYEE